MVHDVLERELRIHPLRTAEMGHDDEGSAACENLLQGRDGCTDAGVIGDFELVVERDVEVNPDQGLLSLKIIRVNVLLHIEMILISILQI